MKTKARAGMPVAFLESARGRHIITLWKKKTKPLLEFLKDPSVSKREKYKKEILAIRQLVKLHLDGFIHKHPNLGNFLLYDGREVKLVDIARLQKLLPPDKFLDDSEYDRHILAESIAKLDPKFTIGRVKESYEKYRKYLLKKRNQPTSSP